MSLIRILTESENQGKQFKVFESRYYYSNYKDILFVGTEDECIEFIKKNKNLQLEMLPVKDK